MTLEFVLYLLLIIYVIGIPATSLMVPARRGVPIRWYHITTSFVWPFIIFILIYWLIFVGAVEFMEEEKQEAGRN